jgi:hypothetical protein
MYDKRIGRKIVFGEDTMIFALGFSWYYNCNGERHFFGCVIVKFCVTHCMNGKRPI